MCSSRLIAEKRSELGEQVTKLRNGLFKISDTREKVEAMSVELEEAKKQVAEFQKQCDEYLSVIVQQKIEADKQQKVTTTIMFTYTQITNIRHFYGAHPLDLNILLSQKRVKRVFVFFSMWVCNSR